jgi:hypothetical protein
MARNKKGLKGFLSLVFLVVTISYNFFMGYKNELRYMPQLDEDQISSLTFNSGASSQEEEVVENVKSESPVVPSTKETTEDRSVLLGATIDQILSTFNSGASQEGKVVENKVKSEPVRTSTNETTFEDLAPSQITIVQSDSRQLSRSADFHYPTMTSVINYLYAKKHGYNYVRYQYDTATALPSSTKSKEKAEDYKRQQTCGGRPSPWCKLLSVYDVLTKSQAKDNDLILFLDSDVAILRPDVSIIDYLKEVDFEEGRDNRESPIITAHDYPYERQRSCTGIFMVRNEEISKEILSQWWTLGTRRPAFLNIHPYEQYTFTTQLYNNPKYSSNISVLKDYSFTEENATLWRHVGTDFDHPHLGERKRRRTFSHMLRKFKKYLKEEDEDGHRIVTKSVIKDIEENHTKLMLK